MRFTIPEVRIELGLRAVYYRLGQFDQCNVLRGLALSCQLPALNSYQPKKCKIHICVNQDAELDPAVGADATTGYVLFGVIHIICSLMGGVSLMTTVLHRDGMVK